MPTVVPNDGHQYIEPRTSNLEPVTTYDSHIFVKTFHHQPPYTCKLGYSEQKIHYHFSNDHANF